MRAKYQQLPNISDEDDTDMPYDESQMLSGGEAMGDVTNNYQSLSHDQMSKRL